MVLASFALASAIIAAQVQETPPVRILRAVLVSKEIVPHLGDRYFSGGRSMVVIGAMLPEGEIEVGTRRFVLYKSLPSDAHRVPAGMNVEYMAIKPSVAEAVVRLPAEAVGYRVRLKQDRGKWVVLWTKPIAPAGSSNSTTSRARTVAMLS